MGLSSPRLILFNQNILTNLLQLKHQLPQSSISNSNLQSPISSTQTSISSPVQTSPSHQCPLQTKLCLSRVSTFSPYLIEPETSQSSSHILILEPQPPQPAAPSLIQPELLSHPRLTKPLPRIYSSPYPLSNPNFLFHLSNMNLHSNQDHLRPPFSTRTPLATFSNPILHSPAP